MTKDELRWHRREIHALRLEIYRLEDANETRRSRAMRTTTTMTDEPRGGSQIHDSMAEMVCVIAEKNMDIVRLSMEIETLANEVEAEIADLKPIERYIMRSYYIECIPWDKLAMISNYSERTVYTIHGDALQAMAQKECSKLQSVP